MRGLLSSTTPEVSGTYEPVVEVPAASVSDALAAKKARAAAMQFDDKVTPSYMTERAIGSLSYSKMPISGDPLVSSYQGDGMWMVLPEYRDQYNAETAELARRSQEEFNTIAAIGFGAVGLGIAAAVALPALAAGAASSAPVGVPVAAASPAAAVGAVPAAAAVPTAAVGLPAASTAVAAAAVPVAAPVVTSGVGVLAGVGKAVSGLAAAVTGAKPILEGAELVSSLVQPTQQVGGTMASLPPLQPGPGILPWGQNSPLQETDPAGAAVGLGILALIVLMLLGRK